MSATNMQKFIIKIAGKNMTAKSIKQAVWQYSGDISTEDILVEETI